MVTRQPSISILISFQHRRIKNVSEYLEEGSPAKVLYRLWETVGTTERNELTLPERVLFDVWTFDSTMGNGICDLIANENYDSIANGLMALRALSLPRLDQFADEISRTFEARGIGVASGDSIAHLENLATDERATLESELNKSERPFLDEIWIDEIIISAADDYMDANLNVLRQRKAEPAAAGHPATRSETK